MNTAISLDVNIFREAEQEADNLRISVTELCSMAIQAFIINNKKSTLTKELDAFYSTHKAVIDDDIMQAQMAILPEEDWEW